MLVPPKSSSAVLVMIRSKSVSICNRFHARWANSGKITISKGVPLFDALVRGESPHPAAPKLETLGYHMAKNRSLYLTWPSIRTGWWQTDRQTEFPYLHCSGARLVDSSRNREFWRGYPNLMHSYGGLLQPRGSNLTPLKFTFNAKHFIRRLSSSILNGFGAIQS